MEKLTMAEATRLNATMISGEQLLLHAKNVCYAMGSMARHFGEDEEHWMAEKDNNKAYESENGCFRPVGLLHDYDYEKYPEEHLQHTEQPLLDAGVPAEDVRAILSHGWTICSDVEPRTNLEKSLFAVDELTGIIQACARMRPNGIEDLELKSFMKKFKDKRFAAKCDRALIEKGCELLGMPVSEVAALCIEGMRPHAQELGLSGTGAV